MIERQTGDDIVRRVDRLVMHVHGALENKGSLIAHLVGRSVVGATIAARGLDERNLAVLSNLLANQYSNAK